MDLPPSAAIIEVGGGASRLVDELLTAGYQDLTVLDLSAQALETSRSRLGGAGGQVSWLAEGISDPGALRTASSPESNVPERERAP